MGISFRLLESTWEPGFVEAIRAHYTKSRGAPPGKKLAWEVLDGGAHRGWLGLGEPAFKLAARRRLGLADARPLAHTVCNFIYRLDSEEGEALASAILKEWHAVASVDWNARYGWSPVHWESLVDPEEVRSTGSTVAGACFRRAGYRSLGLTTGRGASRPPGASHGARIWGDKSPKLVLYRGPLPRLPKVEHVRAPGVINPPCVPVRPVP
jgi:hypothetical protein